MKKTFVSAVLCALLVVPQIALAVNSRDYIPLPPDTFLFCTYFKHISATSYYSSGKKVSDDFNLTENLGILRPVYYMDIGKALYGDGGFRIDPQALIPFGEANLDGAAVGNSDISTSGIADPTIFATFWFANDPKNKLWAGFSPYITMPLGDYDKHKALNLGNNRWAIKPELGVVKGFGEKTYLDMIVNGEFYTENEKVNLKQDPLFGAELHLSYDITKQWYASVDYFYSYGGETKQNGDWQHNKVNSHGLGLSLFWLIGSNNQLMVEYRDDFSVRNGPGTNTFGARWAYFF